MKTLFTFYFIFFAVFVSGQSTFIKTCPTAGQLINTQDGGYAICGSGGQSLGLPSNISLTKLDSAGNTEWQRSYGLEHAPEYGRNIVQMNDGGYLLTGYRIYGVFDYYRFEAIRTYANGDIMWARYYNYFYGGGGGVVTTDDGGAIISNSLASPGYGNALFKINGDGDIGWSYELFSVNSLIRLSDDNYLISSGNIISKLDTDGNIIWSKQIEEAESFNLNALDDGKFIGIDQNSDFQKPILTKFNSDGSIRWSKLYNIGAGYDGVVAYKILPAEDGGFFIGGYAQVEPGSSNQLPLLIKVDSLGNYQWGRHPWDILGYNLVYGIAKTAEGGVMMLSGGTALIPGFGAYLAKFDASGNTGCEIFPVNAHTFDGISLVSDTVITVSDYNIHPATFLPEILAPESIDSMYCSSDDIPVCTTAPDSLGADHFLFDYALLHWSAVPGAVSYTLQYRPKTTTVWTTINWYTNEIGLSGLSPATTYKFRVRAICSETLSSSWSDVATFKTFTHKLDAQDSSSLQIYIYPNPSNGNFTIQLPEIKHGITSIVIKNLLGEEVYATQITGTEISDHIVNLNKNIANGMYILYIEADNEIFSRQIVISK